MKKLLSLALALCMVFSLSLTAFAADGETETPAETTYEDAKTVTITKVYNIEGAGSSPAETFKMTQVGNGTVAESDATEAPALTSISDVEFAKGAAGSQSKTGSFTVTLPDYKKVGIYTYILKETAGNTAGVTYYSDPIKLVVTVIEQDGLVRVAAVHTEKENGQKSAEFANTYSANSLSVTKKVEGNMGDKTKEFKFTVTFTAPENKSWKNEITVADSSGASDLKWNDNVATFTLSDSDTITFENVPVGVTYKVEEDDYTTTDGYTTSGEVTTATAMTKDAAQVTVTNTKNGTIDTGITLDSMPYMMILAVVALSTVLFITKKRYTVE